ncbi:MAG: TraB/GumN family protein [Alistipes sp.]|nr:TraB/GumN family protein [Alistipes sp.]
MKKITLLLLTVTLLLAGCAGKAENISESLLWKVTGNGLESPSYLFGTHHFISTDVLESYPSFEKALSESTRVVGEMDMEGSAASQMLVMEYAMLPDGITYGDLLSEEECDKLDVLLIENLGIGLEMYGAFKPAMLTSMYAAFTYMNADPTFDPMGHEAIDSYIQRIAATDGKPIVGLETVTEQLELLMDYEPLESQARLLLCTLEHSDDGVDELLLQMQLYTEGRLQELYDQSFNNDDDPCPMSEEFEQALNKTRNENWLTRIPSLMAEGPSFIAVGALHLAGQPGLVNRLREMGYTVEPIR